MREDTALVSVMAVNNEIGVIQPLEEIGSICKEHGAFFHTDAAQAVGKIPIDVNTMNIDLLSISGHKLYGPKGVGALYRRRRPRVRLDPIISGGGQEFGLRSGTLPTPIVVGLGAACKIAKQEMARDSRWIKHLYDRLYNNITSQLSDVTLNGDPERRYHGNCNLSFAYVEGESLLMALKKATKKSLTTTQTPTNSYISMQWSE